MDHTNKNSITRIPKILIKTGPLQKPNTILKQLFSRDTERFNIKNLMYFNNLDCIRFIRSNLPDLVNNAYHSLVPPAFKADLFRYCALYIIGGLYMDLTNTFTSDYKIFDGDYDMIITNDLHHESNIKGIQVSFIACKPGLEFMKYVIEKTTIQILKKNKGRTSLDLTGPHAFYRHFVNYFGCKPKQGIHVYSHHDKLYRIKMDLCQVSKESISKFNDSTQQVISVKALGEKQHRELLLDQEVSIPYKKTLGVIMHSNVTYRRNDYAEYWKQNKVFH